MTAGLERLDERRMLAFQFVAAYAQSGTPFYVAGATSGTPQLTEAPQQLTLRFSPGVTIDPASLGAISVSRSGGAGDGFGSTGTKPDVTIVPGSVVVDDTPNGNQVIVRFAETLPDDTYQITIGAGLSSTGSGSLATQATFQMRLSLGAYVVSVVPQPVTRGTDGTLTQLRNTIDVYFNTEDPLLESSAKTSSFYRLVAVDPSTNANGTAVNPTEVTYAPATGRATLTFSNLSTASGLYRLEIGGSTASTPVVFTEGNDNNSSFTTAQVLGALNASGATVTGSISPRSTLPTPVGSLEFPSAPGSLDTPGQRDVPVDSGSHGVPPFAIVDPVTGITSVAYNFQSVIGKDPQGNDLQNVITEAQKQRAREIFELFSLGSGVRFVETASDGLMVATGDLRAFDKNIPAGAVAGLGVEKKGALMSSSINWGDSEYGGSWFKVAMHEIGHALGLQHSYDLPSIMGADLGGEAVFPGDYDFEHLRQLYPVTGSDIDVYKFSLTEAGRFTAETVVARPGEVALSKLDTVLSLYRETSTGSGTVRTLVARNDDYYGRDSFVGLDLQAGTYFIAVTSTGNTAFDPAISDSGANGRTEGAYTLKLGFTPASADTNTIVDNDGTPLDGDRDGRAGGAFKFWFNAAAGTDTIFVDKSSPQTGVADGTVAKPYKTISSALANVTGTTKIIRIAGKADKPYQIGTDLFGNALEDGATFNVPKGVTVMIDGGAVFKLRAANIDVGSSSQIVSRGGAAIQVLGVPATGASTGSQVTFTSWHDDSVGGDSDKVGPAVQGGQWGGIVLRQDSDAASKHAFVNSISGAVIRYGGGQVSVDSQLESFAPIQIESTRPTIIFNTIRNSAGAGVAATPNSFEDTGDRFGPEFRGNQLTDNSINGLFIKIDTQFGTPLDRLDVPARLKSADIVYVIQENLVIDGGVGGYIKDGTTEKARHSGRLTIDPGVVVKLQGSRIELERGIAQLVAEGTAYKPVIFTSLGDNRYGAGGTFDTNGNVPDKFDAFGRAIGTLAVGDWGGIIVEAGSKASIDRAYLAFGGGETPIEGGFDNFNVIEVHQGDLRLANSRIESNAAGAARTGRTGRGGNAEATVFVRGAQPIIVGNDFRANLGAVISINANALSDVQRGDVGRSTGAIDRFTGYDDNFGPLVRGNVLAYGTGGQAIAGMVVRGGEITVESVWDDTDIVHVLQDEIIVQNFHTATGIRLLSKTDASLIVKLFGAAAGFTAAGENLDIYDRIGGTVQIVGQPGYPVILTSLRDDTVGASLDPLGQLVKDTNVDGNTSKSAAGDWRSLKFLPFSNDRNVAILIEREKAYTGGIDANASTGAAESLGTLAPNYATGTNTWESAQEKNGDENRRLGFEVHGNIAYDDPTDVDVYTFLGYAGSEVWIDVDKTSPALDSMVELLDAAGTVLARSVDSEAEGGVAQGEVVPDAVGGTSVTYQFAPDGLTTGKFSLLAGTLSGVIYDGIDPTALAIQTFSVDASGVVTFQSILGNDRMSTPNTVPVAGGGSGSYATGGSVNLANGTLTLNFSGTGIRQSQVEVRYSYQTSALTAVTGAGQTLGKDAWRGGDSFTQNPRDPGMRVILPGTPGVQTRYYLRVRSQPRYEPAAVDTDPTKTGNEVTATTGEQYRTDVSSTAVKNGATSGRYELRVRLRQQDEKPGSTVRYADIRYPTIGIDVQGLPSNSPLLADTAENPTDTNDTFANAQYIGNVLESNRGALSVAGNISAAGDVDWYSFALNYEQIQSIPGVNDSGFSWATVFDIDYADGFRGDLTISVFDSSGTLIYVGRDSNVADDQPGASQGNDFDDLSKGSAGKLDPYIGTVTLAAGGPTGGGGGDTGQPVTAPDPTKQKRYYVAISSNERLPAQLNATFGSAAANTRVRLEPISSVDRIITDRIGTPEVRYPGVAAAERLIDITTDPLKLDAYVRPFTLSDVTLFVTKSSALVTVDAMRDVTVTGGVVETTIVNSYGAGTTIGDLLMRSDGSMYVYRGVVNDKTTAGQLGLVDSGTGAVTIVGNDDIKDPIKATQNNLAPVETGTVATTTFSLSGKFLRQPQVAPITGTVRYQRVDTTVTPNETLVGNWSFTVDPGNINGVATITSFSGSADPGLGSEPSSGTVDLKTGVVSITWSSNVAAADVRLTEVKYEYTFQDIATDTVDAVAWRRAGVGDYQDLVYSVWDGVAGASLLYLGNPATGSAAYVDGQNWGLQGMLTTGGVHTTGLAWLNGKLYGVADNGTFFSVGGINDGNFTITKTSIDTIKDDADQAIKFQGLTVGPQNLEGGKYQDWLFGIDGAGKLYCFNKDGTLQTVFDSNGDGVPDARSIATGVGGATGLAFSPLDINLWHPTTKRGTDPGGGTSSTELKSMYFGFEQYQAGNPTYGGYSTVNGQYGAVLSTWQQDLGANAAIGNNYNLPGGAYGSLTTNPFSLFGYEYTDKPTLYFDYWLDAQGGSSRTDGMRDSARVLVSIDGGNWQLLATNNSLKSTLDTSDAELPSFLSVSSKISNDTKIDNQHVQQLFATKEWRQARVDLGKFAGKQNIRLRFDFSTAGEFDKDQKDASGKTLNAIDGLAGTTGNFNSPQRGQNNQYEGFYIDDIVIGFAERGEAVTGATAAATTFFNVGTPGPSATVAAQVLNGPYQLEIRRGSEMSAVNVVDALSSKPFPETFDTNARLIAQQSTTTDYGAKLGDANQPREQGQFIIESNIVTGAAQYGIRIDAAARDGGSNAPNPGAPRALPTLNNARLVPGVVVVNNIVARSGTAGILFSGDATTGNVPLAAVPYGRIVNNTIYGGDTPTGVGVQVTDNASPTLLNNLFANLAQGVTADASSAALQSKPVVGQSAYWNTATQVSGVAQSGQIDLTADPFVNPTKNNFYLKAGSKAIDSSLNALQDRNEFVQVNSPIGITAAPIIAPERDLYGQLRGDDPGVTNLTGLGSNVYKDRGAIDRVDFVQPSAKLVKPLDGGLQDGDAKLDFVILTKADARGVTQFILQLSDVGVGIDKTTVTSGAFTLTRNGDPLVEGTDYLFRYLETTNQVVFESAAVYQFGLYKIQVNQVSVGGTSVNMIADLAGNPLLPNKTNGTTSFTISLADVPGVPGKPVGTPADARVVLAWTAPDSDGGSAITDYVVQYSSDGGTNWNTFVHSVSALTSTTVTPLVNGTSYVFRVAAKNDVGTGAWSQTSAPVKPGAVPGAPTGLVVTGKASGQVTLSWTAPTVVGSPALNDYVVEYKESGLPDSAYATFNDGTGTSPGATVTGLVNGTAYVFRVKARNVIGDSGYAVLGTSVVVGVLPGTPTGLGGVATAATRSVLLTWTTPTVVGSPALYDYVVEYKVIGQLDAAYVPFTDGVSTAPTATVTGLASNTTYVFRVRAVNVVGAGPWTTATATVVVPAAVPTDPLNLVASAVASGQALLVWSAPADNGGSPISDYIVQYKVNGQLDSAYVTFADGTSTATSASVTGLVNGTSYVFRVAAKNGVGSGPWSTVSNAVTPQQLASAPTRLTATAGNGSVALAWTAPTITGGLPIVGYEIQYSTNSPTRNWQQLVKNTGSNLARATVAVSNGGTYVFRVAAVTAAGTGAFSAESPAVTPYSPTAVPVAPMSLAATKVASGSVSLTWTAPPPNAGGPVNGYVIQYRLATSTTWTSITVSSTTPSATISKLLAGRIYSFRVAARNLAGVGTFSNERQATA